MGGECLVLISLERRRDETLGVLEGLSSLKVSGYLFQLTSSHLEVIAVHTGKSHPKVGNPALRSLLGLKGQQLAAAIGLNGPKAIEFCIHARTNDATVSQLHRGAIGQRGLDGGRRGCCGGAAELRCQLAQQAR